MDFLIETPRLLLREFKEEDAPGLLELNDDPEVQRFTGDPPFPTLKAARQFVVEYPEYRRTGYGRWAVLCKADGAFLGWCGLKLNEEEEVDLGFRFLRRCRGRGFATEAAAACLDYGFRSLQLEKIVGRAMTENKASIRVLEKIGMQFQKEIFVPAHDALVRYYHLERLDYLSRTS